MGYGFGVEIKGFEFSLNGEQVRVIDESPDATLLAWLRAQGLTGAKEGCAEGDCGACTVIVVDRDLQGRRVFRSINSCIALLPSLEGKEVWTVEGMAKGGPHSVQKNMTACYGSQCGFCTPGFISSLFEGYYREDIHTSEDLDEQLCGNLCRCTGYRPIRDAAIRSWQSASSLEKAQDRFGQILAQSSDGTSPQGVVYENFDGFFRQPASLDELWKIMAEAPEAVLVAGGTEVGVAVAKSFRPHRRLIGLQRVRELLEAREDEGTLTIGAGIPLTDVMGIVRESFPSLYEMLRWFASRPIRNRATLGGNLVTASPIGDAAPVLLALGASVTIASESGSREVLLENFFTGYRKTVLGPGEILVSVKISKAKAGVRRLEKSYKVSKRREMDISIVSAGFCVEWDENGIVSLARLAFGGVGPTPMLAAKAASFVLGKAWNSELMEETAKILDAEFSPITDVRATKEYRQSLPTELWRSFVLTGFDAEPVSSPPVVNHTPDLDALLHDSGRKHVDGSARYVEDDAEHAGAMHVWPVVSPHAHAKILRRDQGSAAKVPGVVDILMAEDVPGLNDTGAVRPDEPLLAVNTVEFVGQTVAAIVGETPAACRAAAEMLEIIYEPLPAVTSITQAIREESFHTEFNTIARGDSSAAMESGALRFGGEFAFGGQDHFYLECQAAWAEWTEDDMITVHSSTQHPSEVQGIVGHVLGWDRNRIVVHSPRMGGGFGGKETQAAAPAALAALATARSGRACRMRLNRGQDFQMTGKRHPFLATFEVAADAEGRILALEVDLFSNGGWSLDLSTAICDRALFHLDNAYYLPNVRFRGRVCKTNLPSHTAFRGFGGPQGMLVIEEIMDRVARRCGLVAEVVRERNLYHGTGETNSTHYGQDIGDNRIQTIWHQLKESADFDTRRAAIAAFNRSSPHKKRGLAQTPVKFGISFTYTPYNQAGAMVLIYTDGTVQVNHGGTEMGQGLHAKIHGIAAAELGIPASKIRVTQTRTDKIPNTSATAASSGSDLNGAAVRNACQELRLRLAGVALTRMGGGIESLHFDDGEIWSNQNPELRLKFVDIIKEAYLARVSLAAYGYYRTPEIFYDRAAGRGKPFYYFACGSAVSEVEIDLFTGQSKLLRVDILHDVGSSLNPEIDRGQIEGGFLQGVGWLTSEELVWNDKGHLLSHGASTYEIPTIGDMPQDFRITLLPNAAQEGTVRGSKAVGEPPLMLAISVREAIRDAIAATGLRGEISLSSPATCEAIYRATRIMPESADAGNRIFV